MTFDEWYKKTYPDLDSESDDLYGQLAICWYEARTTNASLFNEWLSEIENFGSRVERFDDEFAIEFAYFESLREKTAKWLQSAYIVGYEQGLKDDPYNGN